MPIETPYTREEILDAHVSFRLCMDYLKDDTGVPRLTKASIRSVGTPLFRSLEILAETLQDQEMLAKVLTLKETALEILWAQEPPGGS